MLASGLLEFLLGEDSWDTGWKEKGNSIHSVANDGWQLFRAQGFEGSIEQGGHGSGREAENIRWIGVGGGCQRDSTGIEGFTRSSIVVTGGELCHVIINLDVVLRDDYLYGVGRGCGGWKCLKQLRGLCIGRLHSCQLLLLLFLKYSFSNSQKHFMELKCGWSVAHSQMITSKCNFT